MTHILERTAVTIISQLCVSGLYHAFNRREKTKTANENGNYKRPSLCVRRLLPSHLSISDEIPVKQLKTGFRNLFLKDAIAN